MLCHEYKCIYIHIPKVAGLSIHYFFANLCGYKLERHASIPFKADHVAAHKFLSDELVSQELFDHYFKFSFVRNPWSRIVSEYKFRGHSRKYDFKTFLFKYFPEPSDSDEYVHMLPQYEFLFDNDGRQLVDYIGRFERLQDDFAIICNKLSIDNSKLPHINNRPEFLQIPRSLSDAWMIVRNSVSIKQKRQTRKNTFDHYTEYYDDEAKSFVAEFYQKDIATFGYTFDGQT